MRVEGGSANLLAHEQLHFDITELFARKLRKAMVEFDFENSRNLRAALQALYKKTEMERALMQKKFDVETKHTAQMKPHNWSGKNLCRRSLTSLKNSLPKKQLLLLSLH